MHLAAYVGGDQADDAFGLCRADALGRVDAAGSGLVEPQAAVGVDHHLDDVWVVEGGGDGRTEGRAQHLQAAALRLLGGDREEVRHGRHPPDDVMGLGRWTPTRG